MRLDVDGEGWFIQFSNSWFETLASYGSCENEMALALSVTQSVLKQVNLRRRRLVTPKVVFHPLDYVEGGLSPVEKWLFWKLGISANTFDVRVWEGPELSDIEVVELFESAAFYSSLLNTADS